MDDSWFYFYKNDDYQMGSWIFPILIKWLRRQPPIDNERVTVMSLIRLGSAVTRRQRMRITSKGDAPHVDALKRTPGAGVSEGDTGGVAPPLLDQVPTTQSELPPTTMATVPETETETEKAFQQLVQYFPTETVTIFMAAVSMWKTFGQVAFAKELSPFILIAFFTLLTPAMLLMASYATFREDKRNGKIPTTTRFEVPLFDMIASAIAFIPWALAVPGLFPEAAEQTAVLAAQPKGEWTAEIAQVFAAFLAFAVSWFLSQLRLIFRPI